MVLHNSLHYNRNITLKEYDCPLGRQENINPASVTLVAAAGNTMLILRAEHMKNGIKHETF